jgi:hypothetical protein
VTDDPARPLVGRPDGLGLAGRPGQRRAVRLTAVALGLLAVALGVRGATSDDRSPSVDERQEQRTELPPRRVDDGGPG